MTDSPNDRPDPEILALLGFEPVPRNPNQPKAWTPDKQREFIAALAVRGTKAQACADVGKNRTGIDALYHDPEGASFRAAWDAALALYERREAARIATLPAVPGGKPPSIDRRRRQAAPAAEAAMPHERINVVCDSCGHEGIAGDENFAGIPDILAFDPIRLPLHDKGWDEERQRAFIAALAVTGSAGQAAKSVGRHELGAERLRKMRGGRGFSEAWDAALEIARDRELMRRSEELRQLDGASADEREYWHYPGDELTPEAADEVRERLVKKLLRLRDRRAAEREAEAASLCPTSSTEHPTS